MSHFTVTVVLPGTLTEEQIQDELAKALAPFDENLDVPRYVKYTREGLIAKGREEIEQYKGGYYAAFLADPAAYAAKTNNLRHLMYLAGGDVIAVDIPAVRERRAELLREFDRNAEEYHARWGKTSGEELDTYKALTYDESFPAKLTWTDEQVHANELRFVEEENIGADGEVYSEYNPNSQWDWYSVGGRWAGYWPVLEQAPETEGQTHAAWSNRSFPLGAADQEYVDEREGRPGRWVDVARKYDIDFANTNPPHGPATFAFLDSEGKWHEKGKMGWFGMSSGDKVQEEWNAEYARLIEAESDNAWFVLVDAHI